MKDAQSAVKLISEMTELIDVIQNTQTVRIPMIIPEYHDRNSLILKTGDLLGALEVFTFANFNESEQEVIFSRARRVIEPPDDTPTRPPPAGGSSTSE